MKYRKYIYLCKIKRNDPWLLKTENLKISRIIIYFRLRNNNLTQNKISKLFLI